MLSVVPVMNLAPSPDWKATTPICFSPLADLSAHVVPPNDEAAAIAHLGASRR
jgi:hypothetical protein